MKMHMFPEAGLGGSGVGDGGGRLGSTSWASRERNVKVEMEALKGIVVVV